MSRSFAEVGVGMAPERIRQIAMGRPATEDELVDVGFALTATELLNEKRRSKRGRAQRRCTSWLMVIAREWSWRSTCCCAWAWCCSS